MDLENKPAPRLGVRRLWRAPWALLLIVLVVAFGVRVYGIQWDQGGLYHPDERQVLMVSSGLGWPSSLDQFLDADASPLNPRFFAYGSLPMYLLKGIATVADLFQDRPLDLNGLAMLGRLLSSLADLVTILLVFLIGRRLFNAWVGLLGGTLFAFTVLSVQLAHFFTVDTLLTTIVTATLYFSLRLMQEGKLRDGLLAGVFVGLAVSTKVAAAPVLLPVFLAWTLSIRKDPRALLSGWTWREAGVLASGLVITGAVAAAVFIVTEPYALLDFESYKRGVLEQAGMASGRLDYPYTRQFIGTTPFWFHIQQLSVFGMGLPLGIAAWGGFAYAIWRVFRRAAPGAVILLSWALAYFLMTGGIQVKFMRYMAPILPVLTLYAAVLLWEARARWRWRLGGLRPGEWAIAVVVGFTFLYALAYANIYSAPNTAERMSAWIKANVPVGVTVLQESWDEPLRGLPEAGYNVPQLGLYEPDDGGKANALGWQLAQAEYIAIYSQRIYVSTSRLPERYPITRTYYAKLFSGELGFTPVRVESAYPNILGVSFVNDTTKFLGFDAPEAITHAHGTPFAVDLGYAQESFVAYDHPQVLLFQKTETHDAAWYAEAIAPDGARAATNPLMLRSDERELQERGGTWSELFDPGSLSNRYPIAVWYIAFQAIVLAFLPIGLLVFRPLADRGYLLIKVVGFLTVSYVVWLFAATQTAYFTRASILLAAVLVAAVSGIVLLFRGAEIVGFLRARWRFLLFCEALFLLAFLAFVWIRAANPDLWHPYRGGEKPMDFSYLNAVVRSTVMPPYDPWFAGAAMNYYYYGLFLVAALVKLTGILPEVAYNLAVPLFFALTFGGAVSITYNLVELSRRAWGGKGRVRGVLLASVLGGFFVAVAGNVDGLLQWAQGAWRGAGSITQDLAREARVPDLAQLQAQWAQSGIGGAFQWLGFLVDSLWQLTTLAWAAWQGNTLFPPFDFWRSSRMIPDIHITEFPYFTFLFADLHAHMIAMSVTLAALGLALAAALRVRDARLSARTVAGVVVTLGFLGLAVGALYAMNSWDYPTYLLVAMGAVGLGLHLRRAPLPWTVLGTLGAGVAVFLASRLLFGPYLERFQVFYGGVDMNSIRTNPLNYLAIHGLFFFVLMTVLVLAFLDRLRAVRRVAAAGFSDAPADLAVEAERPSSGFLPALTLYVGIVGAGSLGLLALKLYLVALLFPPLVAIAFLVLRGQEPLTHRLALSMCGLALAIGIGVEFVRLEGDIERMNTLFKFYIQAWVLLGVATAYLLWYLGQRGLFSGLSFSGRRVWLGTLAVLFVAVSIYPLAALSPRLGDRFAILPLTLDGMAYMDYAVYFDEMGALQLKWDREAIEKLRREVAGSPTIIEGIAPEYRWGARVSIYTGLPSVLGWNWHQRQQFGTYDPMVWERQGEVNRFYNTIDTADAMSILDKYNVRYVYVGALERNYYSSSGIAKFERMVGNGLTVWHRNEEVTIYERTSGAARTDSGG